MQKPTHRDALLATAAIGAVAATRANAQTTLALENTPMSDVIQALANGRVTAAALTSGYLARIEAYDRDGPRAVRVAAIEEMFDRGFGRATQPIEGTMTYGVSEQLAELFKGNASGTLGSELARRALPAPNGEQPH